MQNIEIERGNPLQLTFICPCSSQQSSAFSAWTGRIKCLDWCAKSPCDKRDLNLIVWTFTPYPLPQSIWGSWPSLQPLAGPCREGSSSIWSSWFPPSIAPACKKHSIRRTLQVLSDFKMLLLCSLGQKGLDIVRSKHFYGKIQFSLKLFFLEAKWKWLVVTLENKHCGL